MSLTNFCRQLIVVAAAFAVGFVFRWENELRAQDGAESSVEIVVLTNVPYYSDAELADVASAWRVDSSAGSTLGSGSDSTSETSVDSNDDAKTPDVAELAKAAADYRRERCKLDVVYPKKPGFATIVWFHGGGLTGGSKCVPSALKRTKAFKEGRLAIVAVNYRLSPRAKHPQYIEDAAAAVAWTLKNIAEYGGDPNAVFVSGGSAGGYLTAMLAAYPQYLNARGVDRSDLAGYIPISGQMSTHFHVKQLLKYPGEQYNPVIDQNAPLGGLSKDFPPIFFVTGDRKIEWLCRVQENELMFASLKALGAPLVEFSENAGFDHGVSGMGNDITPELIERIDAFMAKAVEFKKEQDSASQN